MTKMELVARALAASRTGQADKWGECRADALLVLAACGIDEASSPATDAADAGRPVANDR